MRLKVLSLAALAIIIYSCASKSVTAVAANETRPEAPPPPTEVPAPAPAPVVATVMTPEIAEGKQLFDNNCVGCHRAYKSDEFTAEEWRPIISRMAKKAELDDVQAQKIYNYITMK